MTEQYLVDVRGKNWWDRKGSNLLPKDYESTVDVNETLKTSVNTAVLRIPALHLLYLSGLEWPGVRYILGTVRGAHPYLVFNLIGRKELSQKLLGSLEVNIQKNINLVGWRPSQDVDEVLKETVEFFTKYHDI